MKQLKSLITLQTQAENLRDFKIRPSVDFVCQYILVEKLNVQGNFYTDELQ